MMKTDNIDFYISLSEVGLFCLNIACNNISFSNDSIYLRYNSFVVFSFPVNIYDLVFKFEAGNTYFYNLVRRS
jgi:hypothetical protein